MTVSPVPHTSIDADDMTAEQLALPTSERVKASTRFGTITGGRTKNGCQVFLSAWVRKSVPVYECTSVPVRQCASVPVYQCTSVPVYQCTSVPVYQCTRVARIPPSPHPQVVQRHQLHRNTRPSGLSPPTPLLRSLRYRC
jgi:hypothetical protein